MFRLRTDVLALNGSDRGPETQTNVLVPSPTALARPGRLDLGLAVEEDCGVAVVSAGLIAISSLHPDAAISRKTHCAAASGKRARSGRSVR